MTTWGVIGSGHIGSTVARLAVAAGHDVVVSNSRGPETLADLVAELGPHARAAPAAEAGAAGDIVLVSIPLRAYRDVPVEPLAGKVVLDTNNYYPQRDGHVAELADGTTTSSELLQQHLPSSHVIKVFNNIYVGHLAELARQSGSPERSALAIAGDDAEAKITAAAVLDAIGYDTVDAGPPAQGWRFQPDTPTDGAPYFVPDADRSVVDPTTGRIPGSSPTPASNIARVLTAATRS